MRTRQDRFGGMARFKHTRAAAITTLLAVAVATSIISTAAASPKEAAAGTIAVTERTQIMSYRDGNDVVRELQVRRTLTGTFSGTEVSLVHNITHPDGSADLTVVSSCTCTVEGRTGERHIQRTRVHRSGRHHHRPPEDHRRNRKPRRAWGEARGGTSVRRPCPAVHRPL